MIDLVMHQHYENVVEALEHSEKELEQLMTNVIDDKRKSYDTNFGKMEPLANPTLGFKFFKEIQCHYDSKGNEEVKMTLEKL